MVYSRDRKMQNRPIKALLMCVFFMFHSFQDNPQDIFQNCFIVRGRWHVLKHGNKIKANLILVPSVGSTLSLPHQINFPFMIFPLQWLFISKTMILAAMWKCLEYSLMILANFYSAWSDRREAEVTVRLVSCLTCLTINHRWSQHSQPTPGSRHRRLERVTAITCQHQSKDYRKLIMVSNH